MAKQTSGKLSASAASILQTDDFQIKTTITAGQVRSLAASVLSQDGTKGGRIETRQD